MIRTIADQWLAQNAGRKYPLPDDVDTGIPDSAVLDFRCSVRGIPAGAVPEAVMSVPEDPDAPVTVRISCPGFSGAELKFAVPRDPARGSFHTLPASSDGAFGSLSFTAAVRSAEAAGKSAKMAASTVTADSLGVDSVQGIPRMSYAGEDGHRIDGACDAVLTGGEDGTVELDIGANSDPYLDGRRLRLEISKGGGRGEWCQRQGSDQTCDNVLFTVNGERPGSDGDIRISGEDGVTVTPVPEEHALVVSIERSSADMMSKDCSPAC